MLSNIQREKTKNSYGLLVRVPKGKKPTMYDLPSEEVGEPGVPDMFHVWQPCLLGETFESPKYSSDEVCLATDLNLYYDENNYKLYKRPDWFAAVGVYKYKKKDMRLSYVTWDEGVNPLIVVELLSPGTEDEDLGRTERSESKTPRKWDVYEKKLKIPYYVVFSRYTDELKIFRLKDSKYQEEKNIEGKLWIQEVGLGLGIWKGKYNDIERKWLRWYDKEGNWIPTQSERTNKEREKVIKERKKVIKEREKVIKERDRATKEQQEKEAALKQVEKLTELLRSLGQEV